LTDTPELTSLGGGRVEYRYADPAATMLESFTNQHPSQAWLVGLECPEFTTLCPVTGQPDFGHIRIHYVPAARCVESKSLKLYLMAYRNHGSFHEDCVNRIADDLVAVLAPRYLRVIGDFRARGGISIRPLALRRAADLGADEEAACEALLAHYDSSAPPR
jgi:7-cyano-7-deazaguanine reductase